MKIIFDTPSDDIAEHARLVVSEAKAKSRAPVGVPVHAAQVPTTCDDCGETYWHKDDPYGWFPHIGCKHKNGKNLGF